MTDPDSPETTVGGTLGKVVGKAKSAIGSIAGLDDLEREGNLQQAQAEAELDARREQEATELRNREVQIKEERFEAVAERDRLRAEIDAEDRKERASTEQRERERQVEAKAAQQQTAIADDLHERERAADLTEADALRRRAADAAEVARLDREAAAAERAADTIDAEE
jgi:uncharacterized protein YjbJ (UPF0337 family)